MQIFQALEAPPPDPCAFGGWRLCPQTPNNSLQWLGAPPPDPQNCHPITNFCLRAWQVCTVYNYMRFCSFCFEQFFLDRSVANLSVLTINACLVLSLIVFCLKSFIYNTHCAEVDKVVEKST